MSARVFPFSLSEIRQHLLVQQDDQEVLQSIKRTQKNFTISREKIDLYSKSEADISSYSLFYMPTDFPKLSMILGQCNHSLIEYLKKSLVQVFDIGCGPGTFSFAWRDFFPEAEHHFYFIDQSSEMLDQSKRFSQNLFKLPNTNFIHSSFFEMSALNNSIKVAIFGHSINEMGIEMANNYIRKINPDFICMIGPGTPEVFKLFMKWKINSSHLNYEILYPCLSAKVCPIFSDPKNEDWCHQILRSKLSPELHQLGQKLSIDRRSVPFIGHIYQRNGIQKDLSQFEFKQQVYTLVRFLGETKFSWRYLACPVGGNQLVELEMMKKLLSKDQVEKVMSLCVGDRVEFSTVKTISPNHFRGYPFQ